MASQLFIVNEKSRGKNRLGFYSKREARGFSQLDAAPPAVSTGANQNNDGPAQRLVETQARTRGNAERAKNTPERSRRAILPPHIDGSSIKSRPRKKPQKNVTERATGGLPMMQPAPTICPLGKKL